MQPDQVHRKPGGAGTFSPDPKEAERQAMTLHLAPVVGTLVHGGSGQVGERPMRTWSRNEIAAEGLVGKLPGYDSTEGRWRATKPSGGGSPDGAGAFHEPWTLEDQETERWNQMNLTTPLGLPGTHCRDNGASNQSPYEEMTT